MSRASRNLQPGTMVETQYSGAWTGHMIAERREIRPGKVLFRLVPIVPKSTADWMDADWFRPVYRKALLSRKAKVWLWIAATAGVLAVLWYFCIPQMIFDLAVLSAERCEHTTALSQSCH